MSKCILVSSESSSGSVELLSKAREISKRFGLETWALLFGSSDERWIQSSFEHGAKRVLTIQSATWDAAAYASVLSQIANENGPDILLLPSTKLGKEAAGRAAERLKCGCITDAINIEIKDSDLVVQRYGLGGNTISSQLIKTKKKVVSVLPKTFEPMPEPVKGTVELVEAKLAAKRVEIVERKRKMAEAVSIDSAETLVCVGQGIAKKEDLSMVSDLCGAIKAELGCTRALSADFHWIAEDRMVGISGKKCKPRLMISIGVSGQIQHTVGILNSKVIVAINKDKEAPIFKIADYGIAGDLYQIVPKLIETIRTTKA
jgi:electron transfer flavoprotein alpha subunit